MCYTAINTTLIKKAHFANIFLTVSMNATIVFVSMQAQFAQHG